MRKVSEEEIESMLRENAVRLSRMDARRYDPLSGRGCAVAEERVLVEISDFAPSQMFVPRECMSYVLMRDVSSCGSIEGYLVSRGMEATAERVSEIVVQLTKIRMREDPEYAMYIEDKIEDKTTGEMVPFRLNYPQRKLIGVFERERRKKKAIRVVVLKARQWGGSTLTQLYMKWMQDHRHDGWNSVILSQVKSASKKIKSMYRKAVERHPGWTVGYPGRQLILQPFENSQDDFVVCVGKKQPIRRSTLTVASFDTFDNVRGSNFHMAHYSEVAYWKKTAEHDPEGVISSIHGGIKNIEDNMEVYESTGRGASGFFYDKCQMAGDSEGNDANQFLFIPFFDIELNQERVEDARGFARWLLENRGSSQCPRGWREDGKFFWRMWTLGATFEAINWYRIERNNYKSHAFMATEAPIDANEAFRSSGNLVFNPYSIDELQDECMREPRWRANVNVRRGGEVSDGTFRQKATMLERSEVEFVSPSEASELRIWQLPNNNILKVRHRYVVSVDIGGVGKSSDYTVMTVIDRLGMVAGMSGRLTVVARWRAHCRHDILAWKAAALARYYNDALLVIESNTADRDRRSNTEGDHFGTIIEEIAQFYPNLYMRPASAEKVSEGLTGTYGFQTNKLTKQWIIDNLMAFLDDKLWEEPDKEMYRELRIYERKDDGSMGNIEGSGNHDDVLISTAIGLWVATTDMPKAEWRRKSDVPRQRERHAMTVADI